MLFIRNFTGQHLYSTIAFFKAVGDFVIHMITGCLKLKSNMRCTSFKSRASLNTTLRLMSCLLLSSAPYGEIMEPWFSLDTQYSELSQQKDKTDPQSLTENIITPLQ